MRCHRCSDGLRPSVAVVLQHVFSFVRGVFTNVVCVSCSISGHHRAWYSKVGKVARWPAAMSSGRSRRVRKPTARVDSDVSNSKWTDKELNEFFSGAFDGASLPGPSYPILRLVTSSPRAPGCSIWPLRR